MVTETWLRDDEADDAWIHSLDLCINEYTFFISNQKDRSGGGLGLIVHKDNSTKLLEEGAKTSLQYAKWRVSCKDRALKIVAIYHPPHIHR